MNTCFPSRYVKELAHPRPFIIKPTSLHALFLKGPYWLPHIFYFNKPIHLTILIANGYEVPRRPHITLLEVRVTIVVPTIELIKHLSKCRTHYDTSRMQVCCIAEIEQNVFVGPFPASSLLSRLSMRTHRGRYMVIISLSRERFTKAF